MPVDAAVIAQAHRLYCQGSESWGFRLKAPDGQTLIESAKAFDSQAEAEEGFVLMIKLIAANRYIVRSSELVNTDGGTKGRLGIAYRASFRISDRFCRGMVPTCHTALVGRDSGTGRQGGGDRGCPAEETDPHPNQIHLFACSICTLLLASATLPPSNTKRLKLSFAVRFVLANGLPLAMTK